MKYFQANGKLLLFGEYFVLDGCRALAAPCKYGQDLHISAEKDQLPGLYWKSLDEKGNTWFEAYFDHSLNLLHGLESETAKTLQRILLAARQLNPLFLADGLYHSATTSINYPAVWGLGSSSTLIYLVGQWANVDAMELFFLSFTGSGYDIACAGASLPILYTLKDGKASWKEVHLNWPFLTDLHFIYLGKKQDSRQGIARYRELRKENSSALEQMDKITAKALTCNDRSHFTELMKRSEDLVSDILNLPKVKDTYFPDFPGEVKSLGAWGGDFVMALSWEDFNVKEYFFNKGFPVIFSSPEILLESGD